MSERVLFPTDGSENAMLALENAIDQAEYREATLDILHAVGDGGLRPKAGDTSAVEEAADLARKRGLTVNVEIVDAGPYEAIIQHIDDRGVDLVVMATHGRQGLDRVILGSVTERVIRTVDVPVLIVPYGSGGDDET